MLKYVLYIIKFSRVQVSLRQQSKQYHSQVQKGWGGARYPSWVKGQISMHIMEYSLALKIREKFTNPLQRDPKDIPSEASPSHKAELH